MTHRILSLFILLLSLSLSATSSRQEVLIHFDKDRSILNAQALAVLDQFIRSVDPTVDQKFTLEGHTDSDGSYRYNDTLSAARSRAVRDYLVQQGIDPVQVELSFRGEHVPTASNADEGGMSLNRRVRLVHTRYLLSNTNDLCALLHEGQAQHFVIDPQQDNLITGRDGATVAFKAHAFRYPDGRPVTTPVAVDFTEALDGLSMMAFGLSTRSGTRLLETDGMVYVMATDEAGQQVGLAPELPMTVTMPADSLKGRMQLFLSDTGTDWELAPGALVAPGMALQGRPQLKYPRVVIPKYREDQTGKPREPVPPVLPKEPRKPDFMAMGKDPWWTFLVRKQQNAKRQRAQAHAEKAYAKALVRYRKRLALYEEQTASYPADKERYAERKELWDLRKKEEYETWLKQVYEPVMKRNDALTTKIYRQYLADLKAWETEQGSDLWQQYADEATALDTASSAALSRYTFRTTRFGWINCDRFYRNTGEPPAPVLAQVPTEDSPSVYLVYTDMRALINMRLGTTGEFISPPVPGDRPAFVVAFAVHDGQAHLGLQPVRPGSTTQLSLQPSSVAQIQATLSSLVGS